MSDDDGADDPARTVEEALHRAEDKAAMLRYLADLATASDERPEPAVLSGIGDACREISETPARVRGSLNDRTLDAKVPSCGTR